jgi:hypothetical protein
MKTKLFSVVSSVLLTFNSFSQITLEHSYPPSSFIFYFGGNSLKVVNFANSGYKYRLIDTLSTNPLVYQIKYFNLNHSLWKTITIPAPNYYMCNPPYAFLSDILYDSETLFNSNSNVEVLCMFNFCSTTSSVYLIKIIDETSTDLWSGVISKLPDYPQLFSTGSNGWKLIVAEYDTLTYTYTGNNVYSLPGTYPTQVVQHNNGDVNLALPYPNPTDKQITIPYNIPKGTQAQIIVYDMSGKEVEKFNIDSIFNNLILDVSKYPKGVYFYKIVIDNKVLETKKIVVQ